MSKVLIATVAVLLAATVSADARVKHKHHRVAHRVPPAVTVVPVDPVFRGRPAWAQPWQCFDDQGYGRYIPCGSAPSVR
jgi:hypothetical protein